MKLKTSLRQASLFILATISFVACQKDNNDNDKPTAAIELSVASSSSKAAFEDAFNIVLQDGESNNLGRSTEGRTSSCATVTLNPTTPGVFPKTLTIDFGTGCTGGDGVVRKGKIIAVFSNRISIAGTTVNISFDNYHVNNFKVEGNIAFTNNGGTGLNITRSISNGKLTYPDGTTYFNYTGTHTLAQTAGASTLTFLDDSFSITGNSVTTSSTGNSLAVTITTPLVKNATCHNISAGVEQFTYNSISGSLNFGSGTCDNTALLTIGAYSQVVILPW